MNISVIGLGYIGLPTTLLLAKAGHNVHGVDIDQSKIDTLEKGELFFEEHGLLELFSKVKKKKTFTASTKVKEADVFVIAVPTPQDKGKADLTYVFAALDSIKSQFQKNNLIIIESTVAPTDCRDRIVPHIQEWNIPFLFSHCPERAIPGNTLHEMVHNDRIVGGIDEKSNKVTTELYKSFVKGKLHLTDPTVAATSKVMENTYRAVNIGLANELAVKAEKLGVNIWEAIKLANLHPRVNIHHPGPGVGGHCIPIDPWFFVKPQSEGLSSRACLPRRAQSRNLRKPQSNEIDTDLLGLSIIQASLLTNVNMAQHVVNKITEELKKLAITQPVIGLLGYAYKKNVDDYRETPTELIKNTLAKNTNVLVADPYVDLDWLTDEDKLLNNSNVVVITTAHDSYKEIDFSKHTNIKFIYDCHNIISPKKINHQQTLKTLGASFS